MNQPKLEITTAGHPRPPRLRTCREITSAVSDWERSRRRDQQTFTLCLDGIERPQSQVRWLAVR